VCDEYLIYTRWKSSRCFRDVVRKDDCMPSFKLQVREWWKEQLSQSSWPLLSGGPEWYETRKFTRENLSQQVKWYQR